MQERGLLRSQARCTISLSVTRAPDISWLTKALKARLSSPQNTKLIVMSDRSPEGLQVVLGLPERLRSTDAGACQAITDQALPTTFPLASASQFLQLAASAFHNLTTLSAPGCVLPPPGQLPRLRHLTTQQPLLHDEAQVYSSIRQYLPQLTTLVHDIHGDRDRAPWHAAFTGQPSHTLTHLTFIRGGLTDSLVSLLARHPALTHLTVEDVSDLTARSRSVEWAVKRLTLIDYSLWAHSPRKVSSLVNVPKTRDGTLQLRCTQKRTWREWPCVCTGGDVWDLKSTDVQVRDACKHTLTTEHPLARS